MSKPGRQRFTMTFEAMPDTVPVAVRLRQLLKRALRSWNLRCVTIEEVKPADQDDPNRQENDQ